VSNHDDFDLIEEEAAAGRPTLVYWLLGVALLLGFGFAVGLAFATLSNRLGPEQPIVVATYTPTQALVIGGNTATPTVESTMATPQDGPAAGTGTGVPADGGQTATPTAAPPTATPAPNATVACTMPVDPAFAGADALLGCPTSAPNQIIWAAWEPFERGAMLWRSDNDRAAYFTNDGAWRTIDEGWGGQDFPSRGQPPLGLYAPERGFGYVWSIRDDIFASLGWATDTEKGFCARIQDFERGFMLQSEAVASCTPENLYNHATGGAWQPIRFLAQENGQWSGTVGAGVRAPGELPAPGTTPLPGASVTPETPLPTGIPTVTPVPTAPQAAGDISTVEEATRPREQGRLFAPRAGPITLDGNFDDWPNDWIPIETVVYNVGEYSGAADLSARAQFSWDGTGLYVAVRVQDDRYRAAPAGTDSWQGDSIEINLDRRLAVDFEMREANEDDYQLGLAFGPDGNQLTGYRWLPYDREGALAPAGAVVPRLEDGAWRGYHLEALLPWSLFAIDSAAIPAQAAFGFVLAVNDNDGDESAQETIVATSPARTRHDDPTQWGTLILLP
jgi:hypothetical protein